MVLYAADVIDLTPKQPVKKVRKPRKSKVSVDETVEKIEAALETESVEPKVKPKKTRAKKVEAPATVEEPATIEEPTTIEETIETVITEPEPVKRKRNTEKMIAAKKAKKEEIERMKVELETLRSKVQKPAKRNTNPPKWFQSYVEKVQKDESAKSGSKKENKEIKAEAVEIAKKTWDDGFTRDKVEQEFQTHQHRLYSMIFSK